MVSGAIEKIFAIGANLPANSPVRQGQAATGSSFLEEFGT
jgi:hypothetical protein